MNFIYSAAAVAFIASLPAFVFGQEQQRQQSLTLRPRVNPIPATSTLAPIPAELDLTKRVIEAPLERAIAFPNERSHGLNNRPSSTIKIPRGDRSKSFIERPIESLLATDNLHKNTTATDEDNPSVQPGLVKWHKDFETACTAADKSGKPVMLFQLLGKLDQRYT